MNFSSKTLNQHIFLIGFMGAGKTTVGRLLSRWCGNDFIDLDTFIQIKAGRSISDIFSNYSEAYFRQVEQDCLSEICANEAPLIVACGGGTPYFHNGMEQMKKHGKTVYLKYDFPTLYNRIIVNDVGVRPIAAISSKEELFRIFQERTACYESADIIIESGVDDKPRTIAMKLLQALSPLDL